MDITFIWPNLTEELSWIYPPLGLSYLISMAEKEGYKPRVIDLTFDKNLKQLNELKATGDLYCFSSSTNMIDKSLEIAKLVKEKDPKGFIVFGGPHPTILPDEVIVEKNVDAIVIGEGEITFIELIRALEKRKSLSGVNGIWYKENGKIVKNEARQPIENLDELPFPAQWRFPIKEYFKKRGLRELSIMTARGCPGNCLFCQPTLRKIFGSKIRYRNPKSVVDEIEYLVKKIKVDLLVISDDTFTSNDSHVTQICQQIIDRKIDFFWRCQTRVGLKKETLALMKKAGCIAASFGVESGSQTILNTIRKGITIEQVKKTFKECRDIGFLTNANIMVGNPGETAKTVQETIDLLREIRPYNVTTTITTPYPGTDLFDFARDKGMLVTKDWKQYNYRKELGCTLKLDTMSPEEVAAAKKKIDDFFLEYSKGYRKKMLIKSFDLDLAKKLIRISFKNPGTNARLFRFLTKSMTKEGFSILE